VKEHKIGPPKRLVIGHPLLLPGPSLVEQVQRRVDLLKQALNFLALLRARFFSSRSISCCFSASSFAKAVIPTPPSPAPSPGACGSDRDPVLQERDLSMLFMLDYNT
jgi:hypothetical protein